MIMAEDVCKHVAFSGCLGGAFCSFKAFDILATALERINAKILGALHTLDISERSS